MKKTPLIITIAAVAALVLLAALLAPMLAIAKYDVPINDDYTYGQNTARVWNSTHSLAPVLKAALHMVQYVYYHWQGSYSAVFLMSLQPGIFGIHAYFWTFVIMTGFLLLGLWCLVHSVGKHVLRLPPAVQLLLFALVSILCTQFLPNPLQGLYWFNGSCYYCLCFSFALIFLSALLAFIRRTKGKRGNIVFYIALPLLAALLAGGNYTTGLHLLMILAAVVILEFRAGEKNPLPLATFLLFLVMFLISIKSPANAGRQFYSGFTAFLRAGVKAVMKTAASVAEWSTLPVLLLSFAAVPAAVGFAGRSDFRFRFPLLVMFASLFLIAAGYVPTLYTQDYTGSGRLLDIQFFLYVLLLFANVFYLTGWLFRKIRQNPGTLFEAKTIRMFLLGYCIMTLIVCVGSYSSFTSFKAGRDLLNGTASVYYAEQSERWKTCQDAAGRDVVLAPLSNMPELLIQNDLGPSRYNWRNEVYAMYFNLNSVRVGGTSKDMPQQ